MQNLTEMSSKIFLTALASAAPTPGGGGPAAMAGALAAALASMVGNLTVGKERFAAQEAEVKELLSQAEAARSELLQLAEDDAKAFESFMACYRLPKATEEEKAARTQAVRMAAKRAAAVPLAIARTALLALQLADRLVAVGNPGVITDGACSALLARAALRCADYNVRINLQLTKDAEYNKAVSRELTAMLEQAALLEARTLQATDAALA
ncbi:cyclodeaminase/cyclohydrolase family protein [uncultured Phascolarctobacterium sp.]|uniref:cyclodeaminase/cyclohydrolase family protein n=1 Tax=uncultured Phascolarctobacterium sp. TaxID=512296 RepID=UPI0025D3E9F0|nr:cyclodeaminase/cyclohydrolase family protein [uncultured Phascolarctobacterium sp.]